MKRIFQILSLISFVYASVSFAEKTHRIPQFDNDKVIARKTVIYPSSKQILQMHRHDNNRVLIAFDSGTLKVTNDKGVVHYLKLEKNQAYYLTKDTAGEMHNDENITKHPITIMVIELKS